MRPDPVLQRFVRRLVGGEVAARAGNAFVLRGGERASADDVLALLRSGALAGDQTQCRASADTRNWLKRARLEADEFAAQHRIPAAMPDGTQVNLGESPLARLATGPSAFLERHQVEAGERVRRLVERAQLLPRVTMAYSTSHPAGNRQQTATDISGLAADARRAIADIHRVLPRDCAGVVLDVCGLLKGLQEVERDRGWPRRSAKLVLRIGLEQLAQHYGISAVAVGRATSKPRAWLDEGARPRQFG